jgi:hypothetical protein
MVYGRRRYWKHQYGFVPLIHKDLLSHKMHTIEGSGDLVEPHHKIDLLSLEFDPWRDFCKYSKRGKSELQYLSDCDMLRQMYQSLL